MNTRNSRLLQVTLVALLVVALAVPGVAFARPQAKELRTKANQAANKLADKVTGFDQPTEQMTKRFQNVVRARQKRFTEASRTIEARIARITKLADRVAGAGGDTSAAMAKLASAEASLTAAIEKEAEAEAAFLAIPTLEQAQRRAAFSEAKATGREAVAMLKNARKDVKDAARLLRGIVQSLKATEEPTEEDAPSDS